MHDRRTRLTTLLVASALACACSSPSDADVRADAGVRADADVAAPHETVDAAVDPGPVPDVTDPSGPDIAESLDAPDLADARDVEPDQPSDLSSDPGADPGPDVQAEADAGPVPCDPDEGPYGQCVGLCGPLTYCESCSCDADLGVCVKKAEYGPHCCLTHADCDDGNPYTDDNCPEPGGPCAYPPCCSICASGVDKTYFLADFDQGVLAPQFVVVDDNDPTDAVTWQLDPTDSHSGAYSLYLGDLTCHTYYTGPLGANCQPVNPLQGAAAVDVRLQSEPFQLGSFYDPCVYALTFWAKFQGEPSWAGYEDQTPGQLRIYVKDGSFKERVFASATATPNNSTDGAWKLFAADLTKYWGKTVRLVFEFDTIDGSTNFYFGAALDDITVRSVPGASQCGGSGFTCPNDGKACTTDVCTTFSNGPGDNGLCGYLKDDPGCQDCPAGFDGECNDGATCEVGHCVAKVCEYTLDVTCCQEVLEGAFQPWTFDEGFGTWSVTDSSSAVVTWHAASTLGADGSGALYFGDPDHPCASDPGGLCPSYDNGQAVHASVSSEVFILLESPAFTWLSFDLWLSTQWDGVPLVDFDNPAALDRLTLSARIGPMLIDLWTSDVIGGSTAGGFETIDVDVEALEGKALSFVFTFDSGDAVANDYGGAVVDNVTLRLACPE